MDALIESIKYQQVTEIRGYHVIQETNNVKLRMQIPWIHEACWLRSFQVLLQHLRMVLKNLTVNKLTNIFLCYPSPLKLKFHLRDRLSRRLSLNLCQPLKIGIRKGLKAENMVS